MAGQSWIADAFAAVMLLTAGYCLTRLVLSIRRRPTNREVDFVHVLMGLAMAGMFVPGLRVFWTGGWEIVFAAGSLLFGWRLVGDLRAGSARPRPPAHHLQHALTCGAMVFMLATLTAATTPATGGAGMPADAGHDRTPALILALALLGYAVWIADQVSTLAPVRVLAAGPPPGAASAWPGAAAGSAGTESGAACADASSGAPTPSPAVPLSPRLAACCEIAMGVAMGYLLIMML